MATRTGKGAMLALVGLAVFAAVLLGVSDSRSALARVGSDESVTAIAAPMGESSLLYVVDHERKKLAVYIVDAQRKSLRLFAVRNYTWDLEMDEFNNEGLTPETVKTNVLGDDETP